MNKLSRQTLCHLGFLVVILIQLAKSTMGMARDGEYPRRIDPGGSSGHRDWRNPHGFGGDGVDTDFHSRHDSERSRREHYPWWPGVETYPWPIPRPDPIPSTLPEPPPPAFPLPPVAMNPDPVPSASLSQFRCFAHALSGSGVWHGVTKTDISSASASAVRVCEMSSGEICQVVRCEQMASSGVALP